MTQAETVFVRLLIPFSLGILSFSDNDTANVFIIIACLSLMSFGTLLLCNLAYSRFKVYKHKPAISIGIYAMAFAVGALLTLAHHEGLRSNYFGKFRGDFLKIRIDDEPQLKNHIFRFKAVVRQSVKNNRVFATSGHILVSIKLDSFTKLNLTYGDELLIPARFQEVKAPLNPFQFDMKSWLANQNIHHQTFLAADEVLKTAGHKGNPLLAWALGLRKRQVDVYQHGIENPEALAVASTLILGYRADLSAETLQSYSKTGTIHALSVSGMHVGLIYVVLNYLLVFMDRNKSGKLHKLLLILTLIWFYALLSGLSPSVLRSVIMLSIYILARTFRKNTNSYNIIAFSAFCLLLFNPFLLFDVGFQLSYISVAGLVLLQPVISSWFTFKYKMMNKLWCAISLSLSAQVATFPLALYYFHQFPIYFLLSNLFIMVPVSLIMYLGLLILIFRIQFLMPIFIWLIRFTNAGLQFIANLPFATVSGIWFDKLQLLLLITSLILLLAACLNYQKKYLPPALLCLLFVISSCTLKSWNHHDQRKILFFSLPKDHAAAFIHGRCATLITNLQASSAAYKFYVEPALSQLQVLHTTFIGNHQRYQGKSLLLGEHQILFCNQHILLADTCFNHKALQTSTKVDFLLISENSKVNIAQVLEKTRPRLVLIDGTNSTYYAHYDSLQVKNFETPSYNLKKLKAYLVNIRN